MTDRPNKWLAAALGFFVSALGLLYVARWRWALAVTLSVFAMAVLSTLWFRQLEGTAGWLNLAIAVAVSRFAFVQARDFAPERVRPAYCRWPFLVLVALISVALIVGCRGFLYEPFRAPGGSMLPGIQPGARLVVQKWGFGNYGTYGFKFYRGDFSEPVERGDVLVFDAPTPAYLQYVKRVVGLPGDQVKVSNGKLTVNGRALALMPLDDYFDETSLAYLKRFQESAGLQSYEVVFRDVVLPLVAPTDRFTQMEKCQYEPDGVTCTVPSGYYYFLGDNRDNSFDSRYWGFVPQNHLIGKVIHVSY